MTVKEVKEAFLAGTPVRYNGAEYPYISALTYRRCEANGNIGNNMLVQVELRDLHAVYSAYIVAPDKIEPATTPDDRKDS